MLTEAQKRAQRNYIKHNVKRFIVNFYLSSDKDKEIYEWLQSQDKMNAYVKDLIEADMNERHPNE